MLCSVEDRNAKVCLIDHIEQVAFCIKNQIAAVAVAEFSLVQFELELRPAVVGIKTTHDTGIAFRNKEA